jgi:Family of unknown function (DUF6934)
MNLDQYPIASDNSHLTYEFESIGPKGVIKKFVLFQRIGSQNSSYYNLSFGDWDEINNEINDCITSNNSDSKKVLFTVAITTKLFTTHFPDATILIEGSTKSRTRLYQMSIVQNLQEIEKYFKILGLRNGKWRKFKTGINFDAFLIKRK